MPFVAGKKWVGRDNRASGSPAGRENLSPGNPPPRPVLEAGYLGAEKSVTGITRSSNVATVACTGHGLAVGNIVQIFGAAQEQYNGQQRVDTVTNDNEFKYTVYGDPATTATGTLTCKKVHQEVIGD